MGWNTLGKLFICTQFCLLEHFGQVIHLHPILPVETLWASYSYAPNFARWNTLGKLFICTQFCLLEHFGQVIHMHPILPAETLWASYSYAPNFACWNTLEELFTCTRFPALSHPSLTACGLMDVKPQQIYKWTEKERGCLNERKQYKTSKSILKDTS